MELLKIKVLAKSFPKKLQDNPVQENEKSTESLRKVFNFSFQKTWNDHFASKVIDKRSLVTALKCSLSLGLAVPFGLIYSKRDGYWAGLPIAISFAPAREATATFIGLSYSIIVELVFQPTRASILAKTQLSKSLGTLQERIFSLSFHISKVGFENPKRLKVDVHKLQKFIEEAEAELSFRFSPFQSFHCNKLLKCLSKMGDLLIFSAHATDHLVQIVSHKDEPSWKESVKILDKDLEHFKEMVGSTTKCCEEIIPIESLKST